MELSAYLKNFPKAALAFSGGVDSCYLLYAAKQAGCEVQPYYVKTEFQPQFEFQDAQRFADAVGVPLQILTLRVLADNTIAANPPDRCYYCKRRIFSAIRKAAREDGFSVLFDGNNASDDAGDRPGMRAAAELKVLSPLRECGLTKEGIRTRSWEAGLFTWDKPAYACLATRIPFGTPIEGTVLARVEQSEDFLRREGFSDFRVRILGTAAKLQFPEEAFPKILAARERILQHIGTSFSDVLLDLRPRRQKDG